MTHRFSITPGAAVGDARISDPEFRTLSALGLFGDKNGWSFPSLKTLGAILNKSPQAVSKHIHSLQAKDYLAIHPRIDKAGQHSNRYQVKFDYPHQSTVEGGSTPDVEGGSISEVDHNVPFNAPIESSAKKTADKPAIKENIKIMIPQLEQLEQTFSVARGAPLPDWDGSPKEAQKRWRTPLRAMLEKAGGDMPLAIRGVQSVTADMIKDHLTFDAPDQIAKTFGSWLLDNPATPATHAPTNYTLARLAQENQ